MIWLSCRQVLSRRAVSAVAVAGLFAATFGFIVLATTAKTATATLRGDIARDWATPYDLLVRPSGSITELERLQNLVRPNFVSGLNGGITPGQLRQVREVPGVVVAAPLAMVGFVSWPSEIHVPLGSRGQVVTAYRVVTSSSSADGLSRYPIERRYVVVASHGTLMTKLTPYPNAHAIDTLRVGNHTIHCAYPSVSCFAPRVCFLSCARQFSPAPPGYTLPILQPIVVAGIDPVAEAELLHLDRCVNSGRYLAESDTLSTLHDAQLERIPVLVSDRSFIDDQFTMRIARARDADRLMAGATARSLRSWESVPTQSVSADALYRSFLPRLSGSRLEPYGFGDPYPIWSASNVHYRQVSPNHLEALTVPPIPKLYRLGEGNGGYGDYPPDRLVPPELRDVWFRSVTERVDRYPYADPGFLLKNWNPVGRYDPSCLPGFDRLAGGAGVEAYAAPVVRLADGRELGPSRSMADYVTSPPLVLTTLDGARWLADPARYEGQPGAAFISIIRVKVRGVAQPGAAAKARLLSVASDIHEATGLQVDIVKGASPESISVSLPAGRFGRPALTVTEGWSLKGAALRFTDAVQRQDVALFSVLLLAGMLMAGETAWSSVRRRRYEFGVLRAHGWSTIKIAWLVELEMLQLGLAAGAVTLIGVGALALAGVLRAHKGYLLLAFPVSAAIAAIAALLPALSAGRGSAVSVIQIPLPVRKSRPPAAVWTLGLRGFRGSRRWDALLAAAAIALGSAVLGAVALVEVGFNGRLDATVLGTYLGTHVHPYHVTIGILTLLVGGLCAGQALAFAYLAHRPEFAVLRALGWHRTNVMSVILAQAAWVAVAGGSAAALVVGGFGAVLHASPGAIGASALVALAAALVTTLLAFSGPAILSWQMSPGKALHS
jgi:putative ABC transport system permease protein